MKASPHWTGSGHLLSVAIIAQYSHFMAKNAVLLSMTNPNKKYFFNMPGKHPILL